MAQGVGAMTARAREWLAVVDEWERSGVAMREFCARRGLKPATLSWWRQRLGRRTQSTNTGIELVEVSAAAGRDRAVEVVLANGIRLRVPVGFERRSLEELLVILRAC